MTMSSLLQVTCEHIELCRNLTGNTTNMGEVLTMRGDVAAQLWSSRTEHLACPVPLYITLGCCLSMLVVAVFLRLPILVKGILLSVMTAGYMGVILGFHKALFDCYDLMIE